MRVAGIVDVYPRGVGRDLLPADTEPVGYLVVYGRVRSGGLALGFGHYSGRYLGCNGEFLHHTR